MQGISNLSKQRNFVFPNTNKPDELDTLGINPTRNLDDKDSIYHEITRDFIISNDFDAAIFKWAFKGQEITSIC